MTSDLHVPVSQWTETGRVLRPPVDWDGVYGFHLFTAVGALTAASSNSAPVLRQRWCFSSEGDFNKPNGTSPNNFIGRVLGASAGLGFVAEAKPTYVVLV